MFKKPKLMLYPPGWNPHTEPHSDSSTSGSRGGLMKSSKTQSDSMFKKPKLMLYPPGENPHTRETIRIRPPAKREVWSILENSI